MSWAQGTPKLISSIYIKNGGLASINFLTENSKMDINPRWSVSVSDIKSLDAAEGDPASVWQNFVFKVDILKSCVFFSGLIDY